MKHSNNITPEQSYTESSAMTGRDRLGLQSLAHDERGSATFNAIIASVGVIALVGTAGAIGLGTAGGPWAEGSIVPVVKKAGFENMKVTGQFCFIVVEGRVTVQAPLIIKPKWGPLTAYGEIDKTTVFNAPDEAGNTSPAAYVHTCPKLKDIQMYVDPNGERAFSDVRSDKPVVKLEISADDMQTIIEPARIISLTEFVDTNDSFNAANTEARDAWFKLIGSVSRYFNDNKEPSQKDLTDSTKLMNFMHTVARETAYSALETDCMNALRQNKNYKDTAEKIFAYFAAKSYNENHPGEKPISIYDVLVTIKSQTLPADKQALAHLDTMNRQKADIAKIFKDNGVEMTIAPFKIGDVKCDINVGTVTEDQIRAAVGGWAQDMLPTKLPATPTPSPVRTPAPTESPR